MAYWRTYGEKWSSDYRDANPKSTNDAITLRPVNTERTNPNEK